MPDIKITDQFSAVIDVHPEPLSLVANYFRSPAQLRVLGANLANLRALPVKDAQVQSLAAGIQMEQPLPLSLDGTEFTIGGGVSGHLSVTAEEGESPIDDVFDDPIEVKAGEAYVSLGWSANVSAGAGFPAGALKFGLDANTQVQCLTHRKVKAAAPFGTALAGTLKGYAIPTDAGDLHQMDVDTICTIDGSGTLEFSAGAKMSTSTSVLATSAIGDLLMSSVPGGLDVGAGGKIAVTGSFRVSCAYQVRVVKSGPNAVSLGFYRKKGKGTSLGVKISAGISPTLGDVDLLETVLRVVTGRPDVREADLRKAGMTEGQIESLKGAVKKSVQRKLEASMQFLAERDHSASHAIVFDIRLDQLEAAGVDAIAEALQGNLIPLTAPSKPPKGIARRRTIDIDIDATVTTLRVNLLGILNYSSVSKLLLKSYTAVDENGDLIIVDKASADHTKLTIDNLVPQPDRLRVLQMESFLITAAYAAMPGAPSISLEHSFFHRDLKTSKSEMKDYLDVAEALGLLEGKSAMLAGYREGVQSLSVRFRLASKHAPSLFLREKKDGKVKPRTADEFDAIGREALAALVAGDEAQQHRLLPTEDDGLWRQMRDKGPTAMRTLDAFRALDNVRMEAVVWDYVRCVWWADSMASLAETLADMRSLKGPSDPKFAALRKELGKRMKSVAGETRDHFGDPWGLIAMDIASGRVGDAEVKITGESIGFERDRGESGLESAKGSKRKGRSGKKSRAAHA